MERKEIEEKIRSEFRERTGYNIYDEGIDSLAPSRQLPYCYVDINGKHVFLEIRGVWFLAEIVFDKVNRENSNIEEVVKKSIDFLIEISGLDSKYEI